MADAARACGNGHIDLTGRANLQIRGLRAESHGALVELLAAAGLVEPAIDPRFGRGRAVRASAAARLPSPQGRGERVAPRSAPRAIMGDGYGGPIRLIIVSPAGRA